jgi:hypothetical protein
MNDDERYVRECTPEEVAILEADAARYRAAERAEEEALRDEWFALLRSELPSEPTISTCGKTRGAATLSSSTATAS